MVNVLDCDIVVNESELKLRYYVHFRTNNLVKGMNFLISYPRYRLDSTTTVFLQGLQGN